MDSRESGHHPAQRWATDRGMRLRCVPGNQTIPRISVAPIATMPQNSVRVVNSKGVTVTRTTRKGAERLVKRGTHRARGHAIEVIEGDHRVRAAGCVGRRERAPYVSGDGYASLQAIRGLPVAGDVVRLLMGKREVGVVREVVVVEISRRRVADWVGKSAGYEC